MHGYLKITSQELSALMELPLIQRVAYLMGIRPYMDRGTCIVGIKRKISYQSLREILYVAPIPGVKADYPSLQQVRRAVKSLERVGLIAMQSTDKNLILKCLLAEKDRSAQNKADMRATPQTDMRQESHTNIKSSTYEKIHSQADRGKMAQADIPHNSINNIAFLCEKFEKFWSTYPQPQNKPKAWEVFQRLNPDDALFEHMMTALLTQIAHYQQSQQAGYWLPHWKYPANWIAQQSWNDPLITYTTLETTHAKHSQPSTKKSPIDILWESCKDGSDYDFTNETSQSADSTENNVIVFSRNRQHG